MALAGGVIGRNRRGPQLLLANIAFEQEGSRFVWNLYSFLAAAVRQYEYGPRDREHGLERRHFLNPKNRQIMRQRVTHVWSVGRLRTLA